MSKTMDLGEHVSISSANEVSKILEPLTKMYGISFFRYIKLYHDGSRVVLSNNPDYVRYAYEEGNYVNMWFDSADPRFITRPGWHYWKVNSSIDSSESSLKFENDLIKILGVQHGLTYVSIGKHFYEIFSFDTDDVLIYSLDNTILTHFMTYFKDQAKDLILASENEKIIILTKTPIATPLSGDKQRLQDYLAKTGVNRYYIGGRYGHTYLTYKEMRCIYWMFRGKAADETGMLESISARTVQKHIENIKEKLKCYKQTQILQILLSSSIAQELIVDL